MTVSQLTIVSTPSAGTVTPGATVTATTTITNTGQTPYYGISVSFTTPNTADQISDVGNETASSGTLSVGTTGAVWTGDVAGRRHGDDHRGDHRRQPLAAGRAGHHPDRCDHRAGQQLPGRSTDPRCTMTVNVVIPGLTIVKTANMGHAVPGSVVSTPSRSPTPGRRPTPAR